MAEALEEMTIELVFVVGDIPESGDCGDLNPPNYMPKEHLITCWVLCLGLYRRFCVLHYLA